MVARCPSITREGNPCSATPRPGSVYCAWHDPELSKRRSEWSAKGGANRSNKRRAAKELPTALMETDELASWLTVCLKRVIAGKMDPPVGTAAATLVRTIADIRRGAEIEERMADIERLAGTERRSS